MAARRAGGQSGSGRARVVAVLAGAALVLASCGGSGGTAKKPTGAARPSSTGVPSPVPEDPSGVALVRERPVPIGVAGASDGSLMLMYQRTDSSGTTCYLRKVDVQGHLTGGTAPSCGELRGTRSGFLLLDPTDLTKAVDVTYPWSPAPVMPAVETLRAPEAGDTYLGRCDALSGSELPGQVPAAGCAYDPRTRTLFATQSVLALDSTGTIWTSTRGNVIVRGTPTTDGSDATPLPIRPEMVMVADGSVALAWGAGDPERVFVSWDNAGEWWELGGVPRAARAEAKANVSEGRAFLGPVGGLFWRTEDLSRETFYPHAAGPITRLVAAGHLLYGLAQDAADVSLRKKVWVSADNGDTWAPLLDGESPAHGQPLRAAQLGGSGPSAVTALVKRLAPIDAAVDGHGNTLVTYGNGSWSKLAWQLFDRHDKLRAEGLGGYEATGTRDGFVLGVDEGEQYVDASGNLTAISGSGERRPVLAGDVFIPEEGYVVRTSDLAIFTGVASPNGRVTAQLTDGTMWALGKHTAGRTVVRWAQPGRPWHSRDLGAGIGARRVYGAGTVLLVPGYDKVYVSPDSGRTWWLSTHDAAVYAGGPPDFTILPDGTATGGDYRGGVSVSKDLHTFSAATYYGDDYVRTIGGLFARGGKQTQISVDRVHWVAFSPKAYRDLLGIQAEMRVHG